MRCDECTLQWVDVFGGEYPLLDVRRGDSYAQRGFASENLASVRIAWNVLEVASLFWVVVSRAALRKNFPLPLPYAMGRHAEWREQSCRGQGGPDTAADWKRWGVLLRGGACLKIPSTGHEAPPVRRRRFLGGVRVIRVPQVDVTVAFAGGWPWQLE